MYPMRFGIPPKSMVLILRVYAMKSGLIFDIKEFAVHDGPGIRTTVFLKGCPLRCSWCHNPEGLSPHPQELHTPTGTRIVGEEYTSRELADLLNRQAAILTENEGGVTFSGGEPLFQAEFVVEIINQLDGLHILLDTSGYGPPATFEFLAKRCDLIFFDIKSTDSAIFEQYCGGDVAVVLGNLDILRALEVPVVIRIPLIPGVTDHLENLAKIAQSIADLPGLLRVDLLPYHRLAGAKYPQLGQIYEPGFDEDLEPGISGAYFDEIGILWRAL